MADTQLRSWWTDVEHLREDYERRRVAAADQVGRFERILERSDGRFARGQIGAVEDRAPIDDLLAGAVNRSLEPMAREIVLKSALAGPDHTPRTRTRRDVSVSAMDRDPTAPRDVEIADLRDGRRTVEIRGRTVASPVPGSGHTVEAALPVTRRDSGGAIELFGQRPDRLALWALLLGIVLILIAMGSGDASAATL